MLGDVIVYHGGHFFSGLDEKTGAVLWLRSQELGEGGLPEVATFGADLFAFARL